MLLDSINSPADLKKLSSPELKALAQEIRQRIIEVVSMCGGHLASSLGAVEIAVALHYCLNSPTDKIVWDVGHQAYAHKILTGRNKDFSTLRQFEGLSGFPCRNESECDPFTMGHSSTAISLGLGLATARDLSGTSERIAAVVGDGALTGGLCFEALNNAGHFKKDLLVVLNSNEMAISPSVGALANYLNKIISAPIYNRVKGELENFVEKFPLGHKVRSLAQRFEEGMKSMLVPGVFFEELGFRYFGPLDGHNLELLIQTINNIVHLKGPLLLHVITKKGKGYAPAENEPIRFHSASSFDIPTGSPKRQAAEKVYTEVFSQKLIELAKANPKIVAITAAMPEGTGLDKFREIFPARFFDVGIAEAHAVAFASGLAKKGFKPVVAIYSTFLQRAYDQIIEEVALQNSPVILAVDRAGIVGEDGVTHQGIFDIAYLKNIPNLVVMAPADSKDLEMMLEFAVGFDGPVALRYPKDRAPDFELPSKRQGIDLGRAEILRPGKDAAIIALGSMAAVSKAAAEILQKQGIEAMVVNSRFAKPVDEDLFKDIFSKFKNIFVIEEGVLDGGFGQAVLASACKVKEPPKITLLGLPSEFIAHGTRKILLERYGLTAEAIAKRIREELSKI